METTNDYQVSVAVEWLIDHAYSTIDKNRVDEVTRIVYYRDHFYGSYDVRLYCKDERGFEECHYEYSLSLENFHAMMKHAHLRPPYSAESTIEIIQMGKRDERLMNKVMGAFSFSDYYFEKAVIEESRLALIRYDHVDYAMRALRRASAILLPYSEELPLDAVQFAYGEIIIRTAQRSQEAIDRLFEEKRKKEEEERKRKEYMAYCDSHQKDASLLVIPDVHGRRFWKDAVKRHKNVPVVFLGDYLDPYHNHIEDISTEEAISNFSEILEFKRTAPEHVTLLLGNHDIHYLVPNINCSRKDVLHEDELHKIYADNLNLFNLVAKYTIASKNFVMSHAGILKGWFAKHYPNIDTNSPEAIVTAINSSYTDETSFVRYIIEALMDVPHVRGGNSHAGSIVWADESEHNHDDSPMRNIYQVFGHTQRLESPLISEHFANLDCRKAFIITKDAEILEVVTKQES